MPQVYSGGEPLRIGESVIRFVGEVRLCQQEQVEQLHNDRTSAVPPATHHRDRLPDCQGNAMNYAQLTQCHQRLERKLAASYEGWHSGRIDRLEEALRAIEREMHRAETMPPPATGNPHH
jgi:hypothetical protein